MTKQSQKVTYFFSPAVENILLELRARFHGHTLNSKELTCEHSLFNRKPRSVRDGGW